MSKSSYRWLLPLLLLQGTALAAPAPLLKAIANSATTPTDHYTNTCTLLDNGQVVIEHNISIWQNPSVLSSKEIHTANLSVKSIKAVITQVAQGNITGTELIGGATYKYYAYQKQGSTLQEVFLRSQTNDVVNDSALVNPLIKFTDDLCGDISTQ